MMTAQARRSFAGPAGLAGGHRSSWLAAAHAVRDGATRTIDLLLVWHERARQRRHLQMLSDHQLRDIGVSRADVEREASRPFWQP